MREKRSAEFSGKNVEDAIAKGLAQLGLKREDVDVHIVTPGSRGVLGIGAENARVRLTYFVDVPDTVAAELSAAVGDSRSAAGQAVEESQAEIPPFDEEAASGGETEALAPIRDEAEFKRAQQIAMEVVGRLLKGMGIKAHIVPLPPQGLMAEQASEGPAIILDIRGEDLGILIGRRGETLAALQYMTRLIVSRRLKQWLNILLDVEQYRVRRERSLRQLALRMAERAAATHQPVPLEAMTSYDRRVIHLTLHNHQHVTTKSIGEGDARKVVIYPTD